MNKINRILTSILPVLSSMVVAQAAFGADGAVRDVQRSECVPADSHDPVRVIYMHGDLPFKGSANAYGALEAENRVLLETWARKHHLRVAIPLSDERGSYQGVMYRVWDSTPLKKIEEMARTACDGADLSEPRALIGFSRAAYQSFRLGPAACSSHVYSEVISIGNPHSGNGRAGCQKNITLHDFPAAAKNFDTLMPDMSGEHP